MKDDTPPKRGMTSHRPNDVASGTRKKLNVMMPLKVKVDCVSLETMYCYFVQPTMEYANVVWGGSYDTDILKLENIGLC